MNHSGKGTRNIIKWKVLVEMTITANTADDAWEAAKDFLSTSIGEFNEQQAKESIDDYDISDIEPAEIEF